MDVDTTISVVVGVVVGVAVLIGIICFIRYKRIQNIQNNMFIDDSDIHSDEEQEYPDRGKGLVFLFVGIGCFCGFFVFLFNSNQKGFITPKNIVST